MEITRKTIKKILEAQECFIKDANKRIEGLVLPTCDQIADKLGVKEEPKTFNSIDKFLKWAKSKKVRSINWDDKSDYIYKFLKYDDYNLTAKDSIGDIDTYNICDMVHEEWEEYIED